MDSISWESIGEPAESYDAKGAHVGSVSDWPAIAVLAGLSVVGALVQLMLADLVESRWPRVYAWWTSYKGLVARATFLAAFMLAAAVFFWLGLRSNAQPTDAGPYVGFLVGAPLLASAFFAAQIPRVLRRATLDGRRHYKP